MDNAVQVKLPYAVGTILTIYPHEPPTVAEAEVYDHSTEKHQTDLQDKTHDILWEPVTDTAPSTSTTSSIPDRHQLEVTKQISVGQGGAQVVLCTISPGLRDGSSSPRRQLVVAKIYDPRLYGDENSGLLNDFPTEQAQWAALDYSREAAAYQHIERDKSTRPYLCTLDYHGSWAFRLTGSLPQTSKATRARPAATYERTICILLLEYVQGCTVQELILLTEPSPPPVSQDYQLYVCARLSECEAWLEHIGLEHRDSAPRNVMLDPAPLLTVGDTTRRRHQERPPRVILIDFNAARLAEDRPAAAAIKLPGSGNPAAAHLPPSPILLFWHAFSDGLGDWAPSWVQGDIPRRRRWLIGTFGDDPIYQELDDGPPDPDELDDWDRRWMRLHGFGTDARTS